ncbi:MAG: type II toxin-antitoxin system RelE/ParE family toxin [Bacteroidetes bacterium]|nr:MAG: type II toxin-antitoxin system RelE/ParE family toxin [Bacteroidota bacterium]
MSYNVIVSELARLDIEDAIEWYSAKQKGLGQKFLYTVKDCLKLLVINPLAYSKVYKEIRRVLTKKFSYALFYKIDRQEKLVTVYTVLHTSRNPELIGKRYNRFTE